MANKFSTVIPTNDVITYLRIDAVECDSSVITEIENMINSAVSMLQNYTGHYIQAVEKSFIFNQSGEARVYAYPINSVTAPTDVNDYTSTLKSLYTSYCTFDADLETIDLNVGYVDPDDVPAEFILAVKECVRVWYYNTEDNMGVGLLPQTTYAMVNNIKRFIF